MPGKSRKKRVLPISVRIGDGTAMSQAFIRYLVGRDVPTLPVSVGESAANWQEALVASTGEEEPEATIFYIDPAYTGGSNDGSTAHPYTGPTAAFWTAVNNALAAGDVIAYVAALQYDGVTQTVISSTAYGSFQRRNASTNRFTLDGGSKYATSESGAWSNNPTSIATGYLSGKVARINSGGDHILGWNRDGTAQTCSKPGPVYYTCISTHVAAAANEPGVGGSWQSYWQQRGSSGSAWVSGNTYYTYAKQDYITIRGFEGTGRRCVCAGDQMIWEYFYIHDNGSGDPVFLIQYTSLVDSPASDTRRAMRGCDTMTLRHFKLDGGASGSTESLYLGAGNSDVAAFANSVEHKNLVLEDFVITNPGNGDGIDMKIGWQNVTIKNGQIDGEASVDNGTISIRGAPTGTNQNIVIDGMKISGSAGAITLYNTTYQGYTQQVAGVTVKNCILNNTSNLSGSITGPVYIYNNTFVTVSGLYPSVSAASYYRNNALCGNGSTGGNYTASNNAYTVSWSGVHTNGQSGLVTTTGVDFTNHGTGDYTVAGVGSKLYNNGYNLSGIVDTDYAGTARPQNGSYDIGAYEKV